jgi:hypothetical protein
MPANGHCWVGCPATLGCSLSSFARITINKQGECKTHAPGQGFPTARLHGCFARSGRIHCPRLVHRPEPWPLAREQGIQRQALAAPQQPPTNRNPCPELLPAAILCTLITKQFLLQGVFTAVVGFRGRGFAETVEALKQYDLSAIVGASTVWGKGKLSGVWVRAGMMAVGEEMRGCHAY